LLLVCMSSANAPVAANSASATNDRINLFFILRFLSNFVGLLRLFARGFLCFERVRRLVAASGPSLQAKHTGTRKFRGSGKYNSARATPCFFRAKLSLEAPCLGDFASLCLPNPYSFSIDAIARLWHYNLE
jgi:hypothetical protein